MPKVDPGVYKGFFKVERTPKQKSHRVVGEVWGDVMVNGGWAGTNKTLKQRQVPPYIHTGRHEPRRWIAWRQHLQQGTCLWVCLTESLEIVCVSLGQDDHVRDQKIFERTALES